MSIEGFLPDPPAPPRVALDASQRAVLELSDEASAVVIGAPGTGKTTTAVEVVAERVEARGWPPDAILAVTGSRATAAALREGIARRLPVATEGPMARSANALAFEIVSSAARRIGAAEPRLLTGGDQDSDIAALLAGAIEDGEKDRWPDELGPSVRRTRAFRTELRELMMRATEHGITPARLAELGETFSMPQWTAAAAFMRDYQEAVSGAREEQLDSSELTRFAIRALENGTCGPAIGRLRLLVVDDLQEATFSTVSLLRAFAARGVSVVAFGDPDVATGAFRGAEADRVGTLPAALDLPRMHRLTLGTVHRHGGALRELTRTVVGRIGTAGVVGHRSAVSDPDRGDGDPDAVRTIHAPSAPRAYAAVARQFQARHAEEGVPWREMAVIVRSGAHVAGVARTLAAAEIPTRVGAGSIALRDDHAASALMAVVDVGIGRRRLDGQAATELLLGPFGGLDRLSLRRLRLALRAEELAAAGTRQAGELLADALAAPGRLATIDHRVGRRAAALADTLAAVRASAESGASAVELFWLVWERSGLAETWLAQSRSTGLTATEADRSLDGIVALFTAAARFGEREPAAPPGVFLARALDAEVPDDTLSPRAAADAVVVTTPSGAVGCEFDTVAVADLQDGVWPDLRIRGSLLGPQRLVRVATGAADAVIDERREVLSDELRMFALAVSRARNRLILAAASNDDEAASVFFGFAPDAGRIDASWQPPATLRGLTGRLRRELTAGTRRADAASALARLAAEGVPGADPDEWHGLAAPTTTRPVFEPDERVPVSPSKLEAFETSPLDWFIDSVSGAQTSTAMGIGTLVHHAMETATEPSVEAVWAAIEERWGELVFEAPWLAEQQRRATRALAAAVAAYLTDFARDGKTLVGAERRFELELGRARLSGAIDRVERSPDGSIVIVDLKTGRKLSPAAVAENAQLGAYQLAYADGALDEVLDGTGAHHAGGAKLLYVRDGDRRRLYTERIQEPFDAERIEAFRARVAEAAEGMSAAEYAGPAELDPSGHGYAARMLHRVPEVSSD